MSETRFTGKAGDKIIAEIEAQRLGSKLRPIVHLYGPRRQQVGWAWMGDNACDTVGWSRYDLGSGRFVEVSPQIFAHL